MKYILIFVFCLCTTGYAQTLDPLIDYRYTGRIVRNADGTIYRSSKVITTFKKIWACPSTGARTGSCPGWAIDHVIPLDCGGADAVWNMQWLPNEIKSTKGIFSKDRFERRIYGGNNISKGCS